LLGVAALAGLAFAPRSPAQSPRPRAVRVAVLAPSTQAREEVTLRPFFEEMARLGWIEGQTVVYDYGFANDRTGDLPRIAAELVARKPDLIFAPPAPATAAAHRVTRTIPIVFATGTDPVRSGMVASLARPGGNVTGIVSVIDSLAPKLIELLSETLPRARRLGFLADPGDPRARIDLEALTPPARRRGMILLPVDVPTVAQLPDAVNRLVAQKADAVLTSTSLIFNNRHALHASVQPHRLPVIGHRSELADAGALLAYGPKLEDQIRRAADLADKILRGASPATISVQQPTTFELVVNLATARALGIPIPNSVLVLATRVIT
jgi:putative ABC transport system substrate-binding protein